MQSPVRAVVMAAVVSAAVAPAALAGGEFVGTWKGCTQTRFTATLNEDGSVTGTYTQLQASGSFSMRPAEPSNEE